MSLLRELEAAFNKHGTEAKSAMALFEEYCGRTMPRVPGCDTILRLAHRIYHGMTVEETASREYAYRWHLALIPSPRNAEVVFGVPHPLGL
jgi:hypothetical protein